jgi:LPS export ABC transporter protein LptC
MKRAVLAVLVLVVLAGVAALGKYVLWPERLDHVSIRDLDVDLSLKGVNLSQGKDGRKLWNLNATGASYAENGDQLTLTSPGIVYWGQDGDEPVQVTAPNGQVWQKEDRARMWGGVNATRGSSRMRSENLDYSGHEHTLTLTGGVDLDGDRMRGHADRLTYFLDSGDFLAQGHVQVIMN